jgi:hypothetical protein
VTDDQQPRPEELDDDRPDERFAPAEGSFGRQLADKLGGPPFTADPAVDAALAGAAAAQDQDPADQLEVYVGTHRALQDRLADSGA